MIYRFRIILDVKEDVLRDIEIESSSSLEDFHHAIAQSFGFGGKEIASFYYSNKNWEQGDEIPLIEMSDQQTSMGGKTLDSIFNNEHNLIYVYDFLLLWTFLIELIEIVENNLNSLYPNLIFAQGEVPEEAPVKSFVSKENLINNDDTLVQDSNIDEDQYC